MGKAAFVTLLAMVLISSLVASPRSVLPANAHPVDGPAQVDTRRMLEAHNSWRREYGLPPLEWSPKLAQYARQWAEVLVKEGRFEHHSGSPYGENLAIATGQRLTPDQVVKLWADEQKNYDHASNTCAAGEVCGHFTQLVWKNTREVGCGVAVKADREVWVCNYSPPGNVVGSAPY